MGAALTAAPPVGQALGHQDGASRKARGGGGGQVAAVAAHNPRRAGWHRRCRRHVHGCGGGCRAAAAAESRALLRTHSIKGGVPQGVCSLRCHGATEVCSADARWATRRQGEGLGLQPAPQLLAGPWQASGRKGHSQQDGGLSTLGGLTKRPCWRSGGRRQNERRREPTPNHALQGHMPPTPQPSSTKHGTRSKQYPDAHLGRRGWSGGGRGAPSAPRWSRQGHLGRHRPPRSSPAAGPPPPAALAAGRHRCARPEGWPWSPLPGWRG